MTERELENLKALLRPRKIQYPITVMGIDFEMAHPISQEGFLTTGRTGMMVAVRSCKEGHGQKTRLGVIVGFVPIHAGVRFCPENEKKSVGKLIFTSAGTNPAIFIPELNETVLGCESWWGGIKDEKHLREITNEDIQNIWYVRALKGLADRGMKSSEEETS